MKTIRVDQFVRQLARQVEHPDTRFAFFLGAGCSVSSGIPAAGALVRQWLRTIKQEEEGNHDGFDAWVLKRYPDYEKAGAASFYGDVMAHLFRWPDERQREIERIVGGKDPGFGYAVLAQLMTRDGVGEQFNTVLTTNFDDMVADALYLYTRKKPLVIGHEALAGFSRRSRARPLVLKLHGDAMLEPLNTDRETAELSGPVKQAVRELLSDCGLVFLGYGGADASIADIFADIPADAIRPEIYWVNAQEPTGRFGDLMKERGATWVKHRDFDEAMVLILNEFGLTHPDDKRFTELLESYRSTFESLNKAVTARSESPEKAELAAAIEKAAVEWDDWFLVELEAQKYKKSDPDRADQIYNAGIERFSDSSSLMGGYANFLSDDRKEFERAEEFYERALNADPDHAANLGNYAFFLSDNRKEFERAEEFYKRALHADPDHANNLRNYAIFLSRDRKDFDHAEEIYKRALDADPDHADNLGNCALFLSHIRKDFDRAEELYERALDADPDHPNPLCNYAVFLGRDRKDFDRAEEFFKRALDADPDHVNSLGNYASMLSDYRKDFDRAEELYRRSLDADPDHAHSLGNYANFLSRERKDFDRAEELYRRALDADPDHANILNNYANFLSRKRKDFDRAEELYKRALDANPDHAHSLGNYGGLLAAIGDAKRGFEIVDRAQVFALASGGQENDPLLLECYFYRYAHAWKEVENDPLARIRESIEEGVRSPGWDLSLNVERAIADGHPEPEFLTVLASVIADETDATELDAFDVWTSRPRNGETG